MAEERSRNILIIDDDVTALDIVAFFFEERGFTVERCADGPAAIDYVSKIIPDLIIADLMMPGMNGVETVKRIRGLGANNVPIIAFTAADEARYHSEARAAGCNEVVTKPCPIEKLLRIIKKYLNVDDAKPQLS
jgi:two-component system, OmpR family, response regulator ResD